MHHHGQETEHCEQWKSPVGPVSIPSSLYYFFAFTYCFPGSARIPIQQCLVLPVAKVYITCIVLHT